MNEAVDMEIDVCVWRYGLLAVHTGKKTE